MPPTTAHPGLLLGPSSAYIPGPGTYLHASHIYATLAGSLSIARPPPRPGIPSRLVTATNALPAVNDVVLARVTRLQSRQVTVAILVVGKTVCADAFAGVVRREDVRGWEVDRVVLGEGFRVGDVVRGVVISLGDQASYYLSTARNELGVIMATSEDGNTMYPISWKEFRDPVTGRTESRKVAKPF
ncbi:exosome 3'-_5 exonuclease subunit ski4 (Csl4) [Xylographa parallela]|nr:exosome 3'->5 exonuclease subunit ski4 (Csl4) [Xylographa parallela]